MEINLFTAVLTAVITAPISGFVARLYAISDWEGKNNRLSEKNKILNSDVSSKNEKIRDQSRKIEQLSEYKGKYEEIIRKIKSTSVSESYFLPVLITGSQFVGKSSLVEQWNVPWNHSDNLPSTARMKTAFVPVSYFTSQDLKPHPLDPDFKSEVKINLILKVHDFPGELRQQENIAIQAEKDTEILRKTTGKNLGIVLICMLNSEEVNSGLKQETLNYFNGKFFQNLMDLQVTKKVNIDRLILVFNKKDLLKEGNPGVNDQELLRKCMDTFRPAIHRFSNICADVDVYPVFTVLSREDMLYNNQGALIVKGAASQKFVEVMAGKKESEALGVPDASIEWD